MNQPRTIYTLQQVAAQIDECLSYVFPKTFWVRAEISSLQERGGHCYMELVEKAENSEIFSAKMRANCWANVYFGLKRYFAESTGKNLQVGMQVLLEVQVNYHAVYGMSLVVVGIDPEHTLGALSRQRQMTIARLQAEGVMELNQLLKLPTLTRRLAIISSASAAGYGDFCHQIEQTPVGQLFRLTLFNAIMQGDSAAQSICNALDNIFNRVEEFDAVVIIRGGGATTDLSCFDDYQLASVCAQFPLPIITGIGHTRDVSIVDMVAHLSLKTPTAVATFLTDRLSEQQLKIEQLADRLKNNADRHISELKQLLGFYKQRLLQPATLIKQREEYRLQNLEQHLELCSPEKIFKMGYSLTLKDGKAISSVKSLKQGDSITTAFIDGEVQSVVTK